MDAKVEKKFKRWRVRQELTIHILKTIQDFKSLEEPDYKKLTDNDIINVLSEIISNRTKK